jgi:Phage integrase, N-terminal SAM-like domain
MSALAPVLQGFFTDRLARQRQASPHTVAAYRDSLRLLIVYAARILGKQPVDTPKIIKPVCQRSARSGRRPGHARSILKGPWGQGSIAGDEWRFHTVWVTTAARTRPMMTAFDARMPVSGGGGRRP